MSIQAVSWALSTPEPEGAKRLVLIALANRAGDHEQHGENVCWPSVDRIAREANVGRRSVFACLKWLAERGYIERLGDSEKGTGLWRVNVEHRGPSSGANCASPGVQPDAPGGAQIAPESSEEPSEGIVSEPVGPDAALSSSGVDVDVQDPPDSAPPPPNRYQQPKTQGEQSAPGLAMRLATWMRRNDEKAKLPDCIAKDGSIDPTHSSATGWLDPFRLLIDTDGRPLELVVRVLDWSQADSFWKGNILSPGKFRDQFAKLMFAEERNPSHGRGATPAGATDQREDAAKLAAMYARQRDPQLTDDERRRRRLGL